MAVPTIVTISPTLGHTGGQQLVEIIGTGFQLLPPPAVNGPLPKPPATARVFFGAEEATRVVVVSTTRLFCQAPPAVLSSAPPHGEGAVDIKVRNVDQFGAPVAGEEVTSAGAYTYQRVDLTDQSDLLRIVQRLILLMKREIIEEVVLTVHTDYDADVADGLNTVALANPPSVTLVGPTIEENRFFSQNTRDQLTKGGGDGSEFVERREPFTVDLSFDLFAVTRRKKEDLNLMHAVMAFFHRNKKIALDRDEARPELGAVEWEMNFTQAPKAIQRPGNSNLHAFNGSLTIVGFDVEDYATFRGDLETVVGKIATTAIPNTFEFNGPTQALDMAASSGESTFIASGAATTVAVPGASPGGDC